MCGVSLTDPWYWGLLDTPIRHGHHTGRLPNANADNAKCKPSGVGRHQLAVKLEGEPHLSTTRPKVQWTGIADLVVWLLAIGRQPSEKYLNNTLGMPSLGGAKIGSVRQFPSDRMQQSDLIIKSTVPNMVVLAFMHVGGAHSLYTTPWARDHNGWIQGNDHNLTPDRNSYSL